MTMSFIENNNNASSCDLFEEMKALNNRIRSINPRLNLVGSKSEHAETLAIYDRLPQTVKNKIFTDFLSYSDLLSFSIELIRQTSRDHNLTWGALKKLNVSFDDNLFEDLEKEDIVEIYRGDNLQIFRNLKFHEVCSFHFPELFIKQWPQLFERNPFVTKQIMDAAVSAFSSKTNDGINTSYIAPHDLVEISSPEQLRMKMALKALYPLRDKSGNVSYILAISSVQLKDRRKQIDYSNVLTI